MFVVGAGMCLAPGLGQKVMEKSNHNFECLFQVGDSPKVQIVPAEFLVEGFFNQDDDIVTVSEFHQIGEEPASDQVRI